MKPGRRFVSLGSLLALMMPGCGVRHQAILGPNQPPEVELFTTRVDAQPSGPHTYRFAWVGHDPDGRMDHYLYAVGTPADDLSSLEWIATPDKERTLSFPPAPAAGDPGSRALIEPRVFAVRGVDGAGAMSAPSKVAIFDDNIAPSVYIVSPVPSDQSRAYVRSTFCVEWQGADVDGYWTKTPVKYKYKILTDQTEVTTSVARANPDSVRRYYAPRKWAGWDSTDAVHTRITLRNLVPLQEYIFVITAFDESYDYDPIFSLNKNMLYFRVSYAGTNSPLIAMFNEFFNYTYPVGVYDPSRIVQTEAPADVPLTFNWIGTPIPGGYISAYRWALDPADLTDQTPRSNEQTDTGHWSARSLNVTSATLGPYSPVPPATETHTLYIEARSGVTCAEDSGLVSLGITRFTVVKPELNRDLLFVDDTRLKVDGVLFGSQCSDPVNRPSGKWPTAAELDTFLFARGGFPWRCYPAGNVSRPGIFNGYHFDTLGTRALLTGTVPLATLGKYRHVVWFVNGNAAGNSLPPTDVSAPTTALRYMCSPGHTNTLAAYVKAGGKVWIAGGGAGAASMRPWNKSNNDVVPPTPTLTFSSANNELVPGRFMYDMVHWRSEFKYILATLQINRSLGRLAADPGVYAMLPSALQPKSLAAGDSFPPNRAINNADFYQSTFDLEFLSQPNAIIEDVGPDPPEIYDSTLDTLFAATGSALPQAPAVNAAMTWYNGNDCPKVIFSGFNFWNFRRTQCIQLVDFVMQQYWGLTRDPVSRGPEAPLASRGLRAAPRRP